MGVVLKKKDIFLFEETLFNSYWKYDPLFVSHLVEKQDWIMKKENKKKKKKKFHHDKEVT